MRIAVFASGEGTNLQALIDAARNGRIRASVALVVSSVGDAGALRRAARAGIAGVVLRPADYAGPDEYSAALAALCKQHEIGLICLAGFLLQLKSSLLEAYPQRILNIHPALLPAFGGKGMYGSRVHEAVLRSGAKVSGCTVHFVDEVYDHGPIISQTTVPVLANDTPGSLAARVRAQEHWAYPEAVRLFCEGRLRVGPGARVELLPSPREESPRIRRALVSVADKTGLVEFCRGIHELGLEIVSTSGTAKALREAGLEARSLDSITGFPEILQGRVKTLHPKIHGGILLRRGDPEQEREAANFGLEPIDMVVVNLYPFARAAAGAHSPYSREVIEQIDIGGVTLIRAAAKNFENVAVVVSPEDYPAVLKELALGQGQLALETRRRLALSAFRHTAGYDAMISAAWDETPSPEAEGGPFPQTMTFSLAKAQELRYGENPHQRAALYTRQSPGSRASFEQLQGKELSFNNLLDAAGSWEAACEFSEPAAVIFKHGTPCGIATGTSAAQALERAWACDPLSAFGGVIAVNRPFDRAMADFLSKRFVEVVSAPQFEPEAAFVLREKANLRLLERSAAPGARLECRSVGEEFLVYEPDRLLFGDAVRVVTRRKPAAEEEEALRFAWTCCKHVKSNAIVLADARSTVGIGAGQMSRVDSVHMAGAKYKAFLKENPEPRPLVLASDAFFPFRDGLDAAAALGITAVIQPGGSVRDAEVIAAADERGLAMLFTGMRHFKH